MKLWDEIPPTFKKKYLGKKRVNNIGGRERTRLMVRKRDNFTCQDCGDIRTEEWAKLNKKRMFDVHHLNGLCGKKSRGYDKVSEIDGLVTLCHKCHYNRPEHKVHESRFSPKRIARIEKIIIMRKSGLTLRKIGENFSITGERVRKILIIGYPQVNSQTS